MAAGLAASAVGPAAEWITDEAAKVGGSKESVRVTMAVVIACYSSSTRRGLGLRKIGMVATTQGNGEGRAGVKLKL